MTDKLTKWAHENGIKTDSTYIHTSPQSSDKSLRSSKFISRGECIVHCPPTLMINNQFILAKTEIGKFVAKRPLEFDPLQVLMAFLLHESIQKDDSEFKIVLDALPSDFNLPCVWNEHLARLLPPEIQRKYLELKDYIADTLKLFRAVFAECGFDVNMDQVNWAYCCVNTRCFYVAEHLNPILNCSRVKNNMVLIPYMDMCNHSDTTLTDYDVNVDGCDIVAMDDIPPNTDILLCYGNHSNYSLLIEYGFITENNPNDLVLFTKDDIMNALPGFSSALSRSEQLGEFCKKELFFVATDDISWATISMLAALKSNDFDYFFDQFFKGYLDFTRQKDLIKKLCAYKMNQYQSTLKELQVAESANNNHWELLNAFLRSRMDILVAAINLSQSIN